MIKLFLLLVLFVFFGFVVWMNLTPGHFQYKKCSCEGVVYITDSDNEKSNLTCGKGMLVDCVLLPGQSVGASEREKIELQLANFDFNK